MKNSLLLFILIAGLSLIQAACRADPPATTPDTQATIDAAIAATGTTQMANQATIEAAVQATTTAQAAEQVPADPTIQAADQAVTPETTALPTPVAPSPTIPAEEYITMTEEELAALIEQSVTTALLAADQYETAATTATTDGDLTQDEVQTIEIYLAGAEEALLYAEELMAAYYDLYGLLATETVAELEEIDQTLQILAEELAAMNAVLEEIDDSVEQGLDLAAETISKLETTAQAASDRIAEAQAQTQTWMANRQTERDNRVTNALAVQPNQVPADRQEAIRQALNFAEAGRQALADNKISKAELDHIAQLGANAGAGLARHGGPELEMLPGAITDITTHLARGDAPQARQGVESFDRSLGNIPDRPDRQEGPDRPGLPERPDKPSRP